MPDFVKALGPYTHWYPDETRLVKDRRAPGDPDQWQDVIGRDVFDTHGIAAWWAEDTLHLAIFTNFPDANVEAAGRNVAPADLALDLDNDGSLETAVVLSDIRQTGDRGVVRHPTVRAGQVYRVEEWYRPDDLLQHTYGQGWRWQGAGEEELAQSAVPVWMATGDVRRDVQASVEWIDDPRGDGHVVLVSLTAPAAARTGLWQIPTVWGTAVCGNDVAFFPISRLDPLETAGRIPDSEREWTPVDAGLPRWDTPFDVVFSGAEPDDPVFDSPETPWRDGPLAFGSGRGGPAAGGGKGGKDLADEAAGAGPGGSSSAGATKVSAPPALALMAVGLALLSWRAHRCRVGKIGRR